MPELLTLQNALRIEPDQPLLKHFSCDQTEEKRTQKLKFSLMFAVYSLMFFVFSLAFAWCEKTLKLYLHIAYSYSRASDNTHSKALTDSGRNRNVYVFLHFPQELFKSKNLNSEASDLHRSIQNINETDHYHLCPIWSAVPFKYNRIFLCSLKFTTFHLRTNKMYSFVKTA